MSASGGTVVVMLDLDTGELHRPGNVHLVTSCGVGPLMHAMVGPRHAVEPRALRWCERCRELPTTPDTLTK